VIEMVIVMAIPDELVQALQVPSVVALHSQWSDSVLWRKVSYLYHWELEIHSVRCGLLVRPNWLVDERELVRLV
jgi:hypothetical protein